MKFSTLVFRGLKFHARAHLGVVLGAAVGSAALIGALIVGDSVRESLRDMALMRLGQVRVAMASNDRLLRAQLAGEVHASEKSWSCAALQLSGTASAQDASTRANHVQI